MTQAKNSKEKFVISGTAYWPSTTKVNSMSGKYQIDLSVDSETAESLADMGVTVKQAEDAKDARGTYVTLKSVFAPNVVDANGNTFDGTIGNGSKINVATHVYEWKFKNKSGMSLGLDEVQVIDLVEYEERVSMFTKQG